MRINRAIVALTCVGACVIAVPVATAGSGRTAAPRKVKVIDNAFAPTKVTIKTGATIKWVWSNQNFNTHNVTLEKGPKGVKKFHSLDGARDLTFTHKFTKAGTYVFECTIHPDMIIKVTVKK